MYTLKTVKGYKSKLSLRDTERAIKLVKDEFEKNLARALNLERISAPLFVKSRSGINDDLNGVDRAVSFDIKEIENSSAEIIHSLAKWKRVALKNYGFNVGEGLYTDMNAIRRDDALDNIHSIYVDQWDWEVIITKEQRKTAFLKKVVNKIAGAIIKTQNKLIKRFPALTTSLTKKVFFITSQQLENMYPKLTSKEREHKITEIHKTVFIAKIGYALKSGNRHDGRAPDYDDWDLNGDLLFWNDVLKESIELSSMGIRVDADSLKKQLKISGHEERLQYDYHKDIISSSLPLTIGGGIGQSRLCLLLLQKLHIGEVQVSIWPDEMLEKCEEQKINIL